MRSSAKKIYVSTHLVEWLGEKILPINQGDFEGFVGGKLGVPIRLLVARAAANLSTSQPGETCSFKLQLEVTLWLESNES